MVHKTKPLSFSLELIASFPNESQTELLPQVFQPPVSEIWLLTSTGIRCSKAISDSILESGINPLAEIRALTT